MSGRDETDMDETPGETGKAGPGLPGPARDQIDPVSLVAGLVFVAIAFLVLVERFWVELDAVLVAGGAAIAAGVAIIVATVLRYLRRDEVPGGQSRRDF